MGGKNLICGSTSVLVLLICCPTFDFNATDVQEIMDKGFVVINTHCVEASMCKMTQGLDVCVLFRNCSCSVIALAHH